MMQKFIYFSNSTKKVKLIYYIHRLIRCKVRYFKPLFLIILMIMDYRYENP